jgi:RNA polymerase sporulation-specific sigma factor
MSEKKSSETRDAWDKTQGKKDSKARAQTLAWIVAVREGSQESFSLLLERYRPLIEGLVARFSNEEISELNREDLRQEASLVFYHSILTYDIDQTEVEFGLYAKICMTNGLVSRLRSLRPRADEPLNETLRNSSSSLQDFEDPSIRILEQERVRALYSVIRKCLSDYEYRVWSLYMSGRSAAEIGRAVGRDEKSVSNAIYRIRKKLRAELQ